MHGRPVSSTLLLVTMILWTCWVTQVELERLERLQKVTF